MERHRHHLNRPRLRVSRPCLQVLNGRRGGRPSRAQSQRLEGPAPPGPSSRRWTADAEVGPPAHISVPIFVSIIVPILVAPPSSSRSSSRSLPTPVCRIGTGRRRSALSSGLNKIIAVMGHG
jgi:hypothetical protein